MNEQTSDHINRLPAIQPSDLPPDQSSAVERGLAQFFAVKATADRLQGELDESRRRERLQELEIEQLRSALTMAQSEVMSANAVRDEAIAHRAAYEAMFSGVRAMMNEFEVPAKPLRARKGKNGAAAETPKVAGEMDTARVISAEGMLGLQNALRPESRSEGHAGSRLEGQAE
jgi:hypothetical protein